MSYCVCKKKHVSENRMNAVNFLNSLKLVCVSRVDGGCKNHANTSLSVIALV